MFIILKADYFQLIAVSLKTDLRISSKAGKHKGENRIENVKPRKSIIYSTLLIEQMFQGYCCESGIAICAWKICSTNNVT